jgi:hypothetical protein
VATKKRGRNKSRRPRAYPENEHVLCRELAVETSKTKGD